jgi:hypothetical protein
MTNSKTCPYLLPPVGWMNSYTNVDLALAELLLITWLKRKTLRGIKASSCQCVVCGVPCCVKYLKTMPVLV